MSRAQRRYGGLGRKLFSCSQVKSLVDELTWLLIGSLFSGRQVSSLIQLLTLTTTQKFPSLDEGLEQVLGENRGVAPQDVPPQVRVRDVFQRAAWIMKKWQSSYGRYALLEIGR